MIFNNKSFLKYVFPLFIFSPMINLGTFGFTLAEILTFFFGLLLMFLRNENFRLPPILFIFFTLIFVGRIGALINTFQYNLPFNYTKFIFLFLLFVMIISYNIGRNSQISINQIFSSRMTKLIIIFTLTLCVLYVFSEVSTRERMLHIFTQKGADLIRLNSPRFPGLGINGNIYSYIIVIFLIFSVKNYFEDQLSIIFPLSCMLILLIIASKTSIASSLIVLLSFAIIYYFKRDEASKKYRKKSRIIFSSILLLGILLIIGSIYFSEYITIINRFDELLSNTEEINSLNTRQQLWSMGMERVWMSPLLGIDIVQSDLLSEVNLLYFGAPHNEFIFYWMTLGLLGLLGYVALLISMLIKNIYKKIRIEWVLLYMTLIIQMIFDGALQQLRFQFIFFILIGLNLKELNKHKEVLLENNLKYTK